MLDPLEHQSPEGGEMTEEFVVVGAVEDVREYLKRQKKCRCGEPLQQGLICPKCYADEMCEEPE